MTGMREIRSGGDGGDGSDGTFQLYERRSVPNSRSKSRGSDVPCTAGRTRRLVLVMVLVGGVGHESRAAAFSSIIGVPGVQQHRRAGAGAYTPAAAAACDDAG
eukprot:scaffold15101_cov29-Phaeocystis_antarctica.AAC.1